MTTTTASTTSTTTINPYNVYLAPMFAVLLFFIIAICAYCFSQFLLGFKNVHIENVEFFQVHTKFIIQINAPINRIFVCDMDD